jgi:hypothetical protein
LAADRPGIASQHREVEGWRDVDGEGVTPAPEELRLNSQQVRAVTPGDVLEGAGKAVGRGEEDGLRWLAFRQDEEIDEEPRRAFGFHPDGRDELLAFAKS